MHQLKTANFTATVLALCLSTHPAFAQYPGAKPSPDNLKPGYEAANLKDAKRVLTYLATQCQGRGTGQPGFEKAARFVANEFKNIGLKPLGDNGAYFQKAEISSAQNIRIDFRGPGGSTELTPNDYVYIRNSGFRFDGPLTLSGLPIFIEYGGQPAKLPSASDLKGRIVFFRFAGDRFDDPTEGPGVDKFFDTMSKAEPKAFFGVLDKFEEFKASLVEGPFFHGPHWSLDDGPIPSYQDLLGNLSPHAMTSIEQAANVRQLEPAQQGTSAIVLGKEPITIEVKGRQQKAQTENVVGLLEGSDPTLKAEYVVVGGHLDHFGIQHGKVYPGADDDGSGAADVIETARMMAANPIKPRRSIVFITFFGEEQGLLGSQFFVKHPPVPLNKVVAMLQMDMVGRDAEGPQQDTPDGSLNPNHVEKAADNIDTMRLVGSKRVSTELDKIVRGMNAFVNFRIKDDSEYVYGRSDDVNFASHGIPTAWLFSAYHPDYHQETDTIDKIDWTKLLNSAKLVYLSAHAIADADSSPKKDTLPR